MESKDYTNMRAYVKSFGWPPDKTLRTDADGNVVADDVIGGEVDPKAVQKIVEDYLAANPPTVTETDPTVPAWAKAENKPEYTAEEVGAMSKTDPVGTGSFSMGRKSGTHIGLRSHAEGYDTTASGGNSHAEGSDTKAAGQYSHAEGNHTIACRKSQHVQGEYNISDSDKSSTSPDTTYGKYAHIVGNGKRGISVFDHRHGAAEQNVAKDRRYYGAYG